MDNQTENTFHSIVDHIETIYDSIHEMKETLAKMMVIQSDINKSTKEILELLINKKT